MYRMPVVCVMLAGLALPLGAHERPAVWAPNVREADGQCFHLIAACVEACGPVDDNSDDGCVDRCLRVDLCGTERLSHSNLPDDNLPESSSPDSRLPDNKLPASRLP
jgi:hypothetical protein